jgi:hypothetical protein
MSAIYHFLREQTRKEQFRSSYRGSGGSDTAWDESLSKSVTRASFEKSSPELSAVGS